MREIIIEIPKGTRTEHSPEFVRYLQLHRTANRLVSKAKRQAENGNNDRTKRYLLEAGKYLERATLIMISRLARARLMNDSNIDKYSWINTSSMEQRTLEAYNIIENSRRVS